MNVVYILRAYPVLFQATVFNEIRQLTAIGFQVSVFSLLEVAPDELRRDSISDLPGAVYCWRDRLSKQEVARANLAIVAAIGPRAYWAAYRFAIEAKLIGDLKAFMRFAAWAHRFRADGAEHFHAHWATEATTVALLFSRLSGLSYSFTAHAYDIYYQPQYLALKLAEARFAVTVSAYNKQHMTATFGPDLADKIHVVYPLIDLKQFPPRPTPDSTGKLSIISIGRLIEYKGFVHLVEACRLLRDWGVELECRIVGEGEDRTLLERAIARDGLDNDVKLLGSVPHKAVAGLLDTATVYALPCVIAQNGDRDGLPMVMLEAMARSIPVVASDVIGLPELRDGIAALVPPADPQALAQVLLAVHHATPEERQMMENTARGTVVAYADAVLGAAKMAALFRNAPLETIPSIQQPESTAPAASQQVPQQAPAGAHQFKG